MIVLKKLIFFILLAGLVVQVFSQIKPGFDKSEAYFMIRLCNSYTYLEFFDNDDEILPEGYNKYYTSEVLGMDNNFQIYLKDSIAVINFRGSTDKGISWLENIHSAMIPVKGTIYIEGSKFDYCFAKDSTASVHGGFALGLAYMHNVILSKINELNEKGYYNFIITGHSQGGALSNLLRAYLENLPKGVISSHNRFKTYAFAAPMVGDYEFVREYNNRYCSVGTSYNIKNPNDCVPKLPTSFNDSSLFRDNLKNYFTNPFSVKITKVLWYASFKIFRGSLTRLVKKIGDFTSQKIRKQLGNVVMPKYTKEINYFYVDNVIEIPPINYPVIYKDSVTLENDTMFTVIARGPDDLVMDIKTGKKEPPGYQHKPYNYYISFLVKFFPERYLRLEKKFLPVNL